MQGLSLKTSFPSVFKHHTHPSSLTPGCLSWEKSFSLCYLFFGLFVFYMIDFFFFLVEGDGHATSIRKSIAYIF